MHVHYDLRARQLSLRKQQLQLEVSHHRETSLSYVGQGTGINFSFCVLPKLLTEHWLCVTVTAYRAHGKGGTAQDFVSESNLQQLPARDNAEISSPAQFIPIRAQQVGSRALNCWVLGDYVKVSSTAVSRCVLSCNWTLFSFLPSFLHFFLPNLFPSPSP